MVAAATITDDVAALALVTVVAAGAAVAMAAVRIIDFVMAAACVAAVAARKMGKCPRAAATGSPTWLVDPSGSALAAAIPYCH